VAASYSPSDCVLGASSTRCACGGHSSQHEPPENDESRFITASVAAGPTSPVSGRHRCVQRSLAVLAALAAECAAGRRAVWG
jgi:hypothetical protein